MRRMMSGISVLVIGFGLWSAAGVFYPPLGSALVFLATWQWQSAPWSPAGAATLAISGGVMVGWGVNLLLVCRLNELSDRAFSTIIRTSTAAWFVVDSVASVAAGAVPNLVPNTVLFVLAFWASRVPSEERTGASFQATAS